MSAPYLEELEEVIRSGVRDLHEAAEKLGITLEEVYLILNNGMLVFGRNALQQQVA